MLLFPSDKGIVHLPESQIKNPSLACWTPFIRVTIKDGMMNQSHYGATADVWSLYHSVTVNLQSMKKEKKKGGEGLLCSGCVRRKIKHLFEHAPMNKHLRDNEQRRF